MSATRTSFTRGRPCAAPASDSRRSIACQPSHVTRPGTRSRSHASGSSGHGRVAAARPASRSSRTRATVSVAHFLFVPITPLGPRLIQPTAYSPTERLAVVADDAAALVADRAAGLVERDAGERRAAVADRAQDEPARDDLLVARRARAEVLVDLVAHDAQPGDRAVLAVAEHRDRRAQEAQLDAVRSGRSGSRCAYSRRISTLRRAVASAASDSSQAALCSSSSSSPRVDDRRRHGSARPARAARGS